MKVINVTTGRRFKFRDYATMMRFWGRLSNRLWSADIEPVGDGYIVSWPA